MKYELSNTDIEELVGWRRDLHRKAELGFEEKKTSKYLEACLNRFKAPYLKSIAKTGFVFDLLPANKDHWSKPFVILRADMDALPIQEKTGLEFSSEHDGVMHACGHDTHMSMLLKASQKLINDGVECPVRIFFQPAEEGLGGAKVAIEEGLLDENPDLGRSPDVALGIHIWSELPYGHVVATPGPCMAGTFRFDIEVTGEGSHAATPQFSRDAVVISANLVNALQTFVSRSFDPLEPVVLTVGELKSGNNWNVIAESAKLSGTIRVFNPDLFLEIPDKFKDFVKKTVDVYGASVKIELTEYAGPLVNDHDVSLRVAAAAEKISGITKVDKKYRTMGGEDFSLIAEKIPSCFIFVGAARDDVDGILSHHNPRFDIDERALAVGAELFLKSILEYENN